MKSKMDVGAGIVFGLLLVGGCAPAPSQPGAVKSGAVATAPAEKPPAAKPPAAKASAETPSVEKPSAEKVSAEPVTETPRAGDDAIAADYAAEEYRIVGQRDEVCTVLKNGLTIIAKRVSSPVTSVQACIHTGSIFENRWLGGGLSHLLEHLVAGGSCDRRTEAENRNLLQQIGDNSNAYTTFDTTTFFVNTTGDHAADAVDLVTGWVFGAKIPVDEYRREYEVVQRELEKDLGEADRVFGELQSQNRYKDHPARLPIVGFQKVIQGLSRDDVYAYYKQCYVPQNMVISIAGNRDPEEMVAAVRKFANVPPGRIPPKGLPPEPPVTYPRTMVATFPKLGTARLSLGFPSVKATNPDLYALDLLAAVMGQGESSILVEELRDKQKLVSAVAASDDTPTYVEGTFAASMELDAEKIGAATKAFLDEVEKVKQDGVTDERIDRAKAMLKASNAYNRQTSESVAMILSNAYLSFGYPEDFYFDKIAKVTPAQIKAVAKKYLDPGKLITTALLPAETVSDLPAAEKLLRAAVPTTQKAPATQASQIVTRTELENGIILLVKRVQTAPVVSIQLYAKGGLLAEDAKTNGLGSLAMTTVSRGTTNRSASEIASFFDSIGGSISATSGNNSWSWQTTCLAEDFPKTIEVFADVVNHPRFADGEVAAIKKRIAAAIDSQDQDWFAGGRRFFMRAYYGPQNSPYQFSALGTKENIEAFTPEQVRKWYTEQVLTGRRVLAIYGDVDPAAAKLLATNYLGGGKKLPARGNDFVPVLSSDSSAGSVNIAKIDVQKWDNPEASVFVGFKSSSSYGEKDAAALIVADTLCSGFTYPTGYIFETLRGQGLVYDANAQNFWGVGEKGTGVFWGYAGCDPKNVDKVLDGILLNVARMQGSPKDIDEDWFTRAKRLIAAVDAMENETAQSQATTAATDELLGPGYDYHNKFADRINAVRLSDVQQVARARLRDCIVVISTSKPELIKAKAGPRKYESFPPVDLAPQGVQHDTTGAK